MADGYPPDLEQCSNSGNSSYSGNSSNRRNFSSGWTNQTFTSANLILSMFWLGIAASNSVTRKTTRPASVTYNLTSSKLHRHKIIKNDDMGVNIRVPRLMRPCRGFFYLPVPKS